MVIDTSALLAILKVEPEALAFLGCLAGPGPRRLSTATLLESRIVVERQLGRPGQAELDLLLSRAQITPVPLDDLHVHWALQAPLLFKGTDFAATDLDVAVISLG
jgi:ribonuclease VapC